MNYPIDGYFDFYFNIKQVFGFLDLINCLICFVLFLSFKSR
ncbi:hypothetical protein HMPREF1563_1059 [Providencia alcalifaciens 205/92]|uniref:Signal peptidase II n=1 Tax=Providencia alcalifaciens 205/92 TaxID=1256988 RepID=A0AAV3MAN8_9GAMM|nr:hypothetical protein HMPREF1563_1059 [Providencia alcalifaciens 205/92]